MYRLVYLNALTPVGVTVRNHDLVVGGVSLRWALRFQMSTQQLASTPHFSNSFLGPWDQTLYPGSVELLERPPKQ